MALYYNEGNEEEEEEASLSPESLTLMQRDPDCKLILQMNQLSLEHQIILKDLSNTNILLVLGQNRKGKSKLSKEFA